MSVETSRMSQPGDGEPDDGQRRFAFRSAHSGADDTDLNDRLDDDDLDGDGVVRGSVVDEDDDTVEEAADRDAADRDAVVAGTEEPQPTFTPVDDGPVGSATDAGAPTLNETDDVPVVPAQAAAPVTEVPVADAAATGALSSAAAVDVNQPLLGDAVGLRASWQQAQAGFVDDPRAAVADAAELVEHTAQTLIGSLQQRQRALRTQWDNNGSAGAGPAAAGELSDTEQLRHLMQDYRSLFNQLCRP
jgi:hypothetical protein